MALVINPNVPSFFTAYPNAPVVYSTEDGDDLYLNQFLEKATIEAGVNVKKLYSIDKVLFSVRVFPETFAYVMRHDVGADPIDVVRVNGFDEPPMGQSAEEIAEAWDSALGAAGIFAAPVLAEELEPNIITMTIVIIEDVVMDFITQSLATIELEQIFN